MKIAILISGFFRTFSYNIDKLLQSFENYDVDKSFNILSQENDGQVTI